MAVTVSKYNHTNKKWINGEVTKTTLRLMLLNNTASFVATHTALNSVAGAGHTKEVYGNGWTQGGETFANVAVTIVNTNQAMLDADDIRKTATGGDIANAYAAVIYDDTDANDAPLWYIDFGQGETAGQDTDFLYVVNASGIWLVN